MNKYKIIITTTFVYEMEVQAPSANKAQQIAEDSLDAALDCEPDTNIKVKLIKEGN